MTSARKRAPARVRHGHAGAGPRPYRTRPSPGAARRGDREPVRGVLPRTRVRHDRPALIDFGGETAPPRPGRMVTLVAHVAEPHVPERPRPRSAGRGRDHRRRGAGGRHRAAAGAGVDARRARPARAPGGGRVRRRARACSAWTSWAGRCSPTSPATAASRPLPAVRGERARPWSRSPGCCAPPRRGRGLRPAAGGGLGGRLRRRRRTRDHRALRRHPGERGVP